MDLTEAEEAAQKAAEEIERITRDVKAFGERMADKINRIVQQRPPQPGLLTLAAVAIAGAFLVKDAIKLAGKEMSLRRKQSEFEVIQGNLPKVPPHIPPSPLFN